MLNDPNSFAARVNDDCSDGINVIYYCVVTMNASNQKPTILVVDDSRVDLEIISIMCDSMGCEVVLASDGFEALDYYRERPYDLVVTDFVMDPMNGIQIISHIKLINPDAACIMVTGSPSGDVRRFAEEAGVDLITKPIQAPELKESLRLALNKFRGATEKVSGIALSNRMDNCRVLTEHSPYVHERRKAIAATIKSQKPLLIAGPHGAGKNELVRFIHDNGPHAGREVVELHCGLANEQRLRDELIAEGGGWRRLLREAVGSTLVLDQILHLPFSVQKDLAGQFSSITAKMLVLAVSDDSLEDALERGLIDDEFYFKVSMDQIQLPAVETS